MKWKIVHIDETESTNQWLKEHGEDDMVVVADYQTAGRGCGTNTWESERGQNLLFSVLLHPKQVVASRQFHISMAVSVAICEALEQFIGDVSIKWPNDIYWRDGKLGGILIEHTLQGSGIKDSIIGVGLNVNQRQCTSDAPNPVSLWQIGYMSRLYRRKGFHPYVDCNGAFMAQIAAIEDDGRIVLSDEDGRQRTYAFKEVQFII